MCPSSVCTRHAAISGAIMSESNVTVGIERRGISGGVFSECAVSIVFVVFGEEAETLREFTFDDELCEGA